MIFSICGLISDLPDIELNGKFACLMGIDHRHLREIDCSLVIVGGPATGAECGANQYTSPHIAPKCALWQLLKLAT